MSRTWWVAVVCLGAVLVSCGDGDDAPAPGTTPCPVESPSYDASLIPADLPIDEWGTVQEAQVTRGFVSIRAIATEPIVTLYPPIARRLLDERYRILSGDNEGFEAEIFFARGQEYVGTFTLQDLCEGQIRVRLVLGGKRYEGKGS